MTLRPALVIGLVALHALTGVPLGAWCVAAGRADASACCCGPDACPSEKDGPAGLEAGCCDPGSSAPRSEPANPPTQEVLREVSGGTLPQVASVFEDPAVDSTAPALAPAPAVPTPSPPFYDLLHRYLI